MARGAVNLAGTALSILLLAGFPGSGAAAGEDPAAADQAPDEMLLLGEIPSVYGASRYEQKVTEAPSSVSIVTGTDIKRYGYRTLADILRSVRGFYVSYDRDYSYLGVRGFARPGDYNTRILLLVDGHRVNDAIYEQAAVGTEFPLDVDLIDRVEVIRGPSSSLYGSNAFFGVVNVITKTGRDIDGIEASGEAGSFRTFKERATGGKRGAGGLEALVSGTLYDSRGQSLYFPEYDDPADNHGLSGNADRDRSRGAFAKVSRGDFTLTGLYQIRDKQVPTGYYGTAFGDPGNRTVDERYYADLRFERNTDPRTTVTAQVSYDWYGFRGDYVSVDNALNPVPPHHYANRDAVAGASWGAELRAVRKVFGAHRVTIGGEYRSLFRQDQKFFDVSPYAVHLDDRRSDEVWAGYLQDDVDIRRDLVLNAGIRYDHYRLFGGTVNPRVGLIWSPLETTTVKLLYGRAFRAPNAYEAFYNDGNLSMKANPRLSPEKIAAYEAVLEQFVGDHLHLTAAAYHYRITDLIEQVTDDADGLLVFTNMKEVRARGFEFEAEGKLPHGVEGRASYMVQKTKDDLTGEELTNSPRHMAKFNLVVPLRQGKLFSGAEIQYTGPRKTRTGPEAGGYTVANLTLFAQRILGGLEASASVYNVFDRKYGDPGGEELLQNVIPQDGRSFRGKITYRF